MRHKLHTIKASEMTLEELRQEYKNIRDRASWSNYVTKEEFDKAVRDLLAEHKVTSPTPQQYLKAARKLCLKCRRCAGTGQFITYVENNIPKGPGGICFRCNGKGCQDDNDARRNYGADLHVKVY